MPEEVPYEKFEEIICHNCDKNIKIESGDYQCPLCDDVIRCWECYDYINKDNIVEFFSGNSRYCDNCHDDNN